jgi:hypothetical protein
MLMKAYLLYLFWRLCLLRKACPQRMACLLSRACLLKACRQELQELLPRMVSRQSWDSLLRKACLPLLKKVFSTMYKPSAMLSRQLILALQPCERLHRQKCHLLAVPP